MDRQKVLQEVFTSNRYELREVTNSLRVAISRCIINKNKYGYGGAECVFCTS